MIFPEQNMSRDFQLVASLQRFSLGHRYAERYWILVQLPINLLRACFCDTRLWKRLRLSDSRMNNRRSRVNPAHFKRAAQCDFRLVTQSLTHVESFFERLRTGRFQVHGYNDSFVTAPAFIHGAERRRSTAVKRRPYWAIDKIVVT